ncbi:MAG: hypothetical protein KC414_06595 [Romboutsia sp.]|nr:hypothetical protein [Romboutsia sp.]
MNNEDDYFKEFRVDYYKNADFDYIGEKVRALFNRYKRLKDDKKKNRIVLDIYVHYIQSLEIFFINSLAISKSINSFPLALFISSKEIKKEVEGNFLRHSRFLDWLFTEVILATIQDKEEKIKRNETYSNIIKECAKDYLDNYELLNAYKHGFRINAEFRKYILSLSTKDKNNYKIGEYDSTISYLSREKNNNIPIISENQIKFNINRVFGKCIFIYVLLNNIQYTILAMYGEKKKSYKRADFSIIDNESWMKSFGDFSLKRPLFRQREK